MFHIKNIINSYTDSVKKPQPLPFCKPFIDCLLLFVAIVLIYDLLNTLVSFGVCSQLWNLSSCYFRYFSTNNVYLCVRFWQEVFAACFSLTRLGSMGFDLKPGAAPVTSSQTSCSKVIRLFS